MKIFILGLLSLAVCLNALSISVVKRDAKDDLLVQTEKLRKLAADEIEKLKAAGKHELAAGIEKLDKIVIDLETQLQGLNPQTAIGKGLLAVVEAGLKRVETAMEAEIKKLSGSFYADDELAKLLAQLEEAKKSLSGSDTIEALKKKIEEEMKKAMGGFYYADDVKEQLIIQSEKLRKLAADEIEKLKAAGKHELAFGLEKLDKVVMDLETQLHALNPQTEIGKGLLAVLEAGLKKAETAMEAEIKKLSGSFFADEKKDDLLAQTDKLKKLAADEIAKLKAEGKMVLAAGIEKLDKTLVDIETQLKGLNPQTEVGKGLLAIVEAGLKKVETALEAEIKKLSGGFFADEKKDELLAQTDKLKKLAADEIAKLKAEGKQVLAAGIQKLDKTLVDLETQLKGLNPQTEVGKGLLAIVEAGLKKVETALEAEIKKLSGGFFADEKKDDLLAQTDKLKKLAADEIAKLKAEGKMVLAAGIEKLDKTLVDLETQLKGLNPQTEVGKGLLAIVEAGLKKVETALEAEIKKLSGGFFADEKKDELLAQTDKLKKLAADEIAKLKAEGKVVLAAGIQKLDKTLVDLETQLKGLNPQTEVGKGLLAIVEAGLKKVETALEAEIKKLSGGFFADEKKDDLLAQTDKLKKLAADEIAKLKAEGKMVLAAGIEKLDKTLVDIETQLKGLNPQTEVGKGLLAVVEAGLKKVETALEAEIKKLSGGFFADEKKDELLAQTDKLKKLAADEIAKLKAEGKVVLAAGIQKLDKTLVDLETQLKGLNPQTEVGKGLLAIVEAGLKKVETALEAEIKKLSGGFYADDELEKLKAQLEDELKKMGSTSPVIDDIRAKIEAELKKMAGGFF